MKLFIGILELADPHRMENSTGVACGSEASCHLRPEGSEAISPAASHVTILSHALLADTQHARTHTD